MFAVLTDLRLQRITADYAVVDTVRVPRETFARIWEAWRDGYTDSIAQHTGVPRAEIAERWREMLDCVRDPRGDALWQVPTWPAREPDRWRRGALYAGKMGRDILVLGASAGGLKALCRILAGLPRDLNAAVFVCQHIAAGQPSVLPKILQRYGGFPAEHPVDGQKIEKGHVYVAPPDFHLIVKEDVVRVVRGPQENRFRPAIDAMFRSAAMAHGPNVVGAVLTGYLADGTVGLQAIKKCGGIAVVQDPEDAQQPSMPSHAMRYVKVDHCVPVDEMPGLLARLLAEKPSPRADYPAPDDIRVECNIAEQEMNTQEFLDNVESIGDRTTYACPLCNGSTWQLGDEDPVRFRCHVGHSFTADYFWLELNQNLENALWSAVRIMEEKVTFSRQLAGRMRRHGLRDAADRYERQAATVDKELSTVRDVLVDGAATKRQITEE